MIQHRIPKAITLLGLAITLIGLTFKLNHLMGAPIIFNLGVATIVVGLLWWAVGLTRK